ncbi:VWA domain-containing protein [candidate division KSB1 bacterium]|nr:VWA domain-containing protein [candidate division KSB1 bacterium]
MKFLNYSLLPVLFLSSAVYPQGFFIPGERSQAPALISHSLDVAVSNQAAVCHVEQVFENHSASTIEGIYYFPIPQDANVSSFAMWVNGKKLEGELLSRNEARKIYESIVRRNIDPALLEYADYRFFRVNIFPIPPGEERKIELDYNQVLPMTDGLVRFFYPIHGESKVGHTGIMPRPVPDTHRFPVPRHRDENLSDPGHRKPGRQIFQLNISSDICIKNVYSPSHEIDIDRESDHRVRVSYEGDRSKNTADFLVYYSLDENQLGASLLCHHPSGKDGYFMLLISPKTDMDEADRQSQDIIYVLDTSGSMDGEKISQAKSALEYCLQHMRGDDRFAIVSFSTSVKTFRDELCPVRTYRSEALEYIENIRAKGGTNIYAALGQALTFERDSRRLVNVIFITDGLPTAGNTNVDDIVEHVRQQNKGARVFAFGVGYDVNTFLLDKVAQHSRAASDYITPDEDIEQNISLFFDKVANPVLTDLKLDFGDLRTDDIYPAQLPDLFHGAQLVVVGRYKSSGTAGITLSGENRGNPKRYRYRMDFSSERQNPFIAQLWASRKVAYLMDEIRENGSNQELTKEIEDLCLEYGIMSPFTSFLVQEDDIPVLTDGRPMRSRSSLGKTAAHSKTPAAAVPLMSSEAGSAVGFEAVTMSDKLNEMKRSERVKEEPRAGVKVIDGITFYLRNGEWVDSRYKDQPVIEFLHGSSAYVNLLMAYPTLGRFMTLGDKVVVMFEKKFIRIGEKGHTDLSEQEIKKLF